MSDVSLFISHTYPGAEPDKSSELRICVVGPHQPQAVYVRVLGNVLAQKCSSSISRVPIDFRKFMNCLNCFAVLMNKQFPSVFCVTILASLGSEARRHGDGQLECK